MRIQQPMSEMTRTCLYICQNLAFISALYTWPVCIHSQLNGAKIGISTTSLGLEICLQTHMIVLRNSLLHSVPESHFLSKPITQGIIRERKRDATAGDLVRGVQRAIDVFIGSNNDLNVHIVLGVDLVWLVYEVVAGVEILKQMILNLVEIAIGCPAVGIHYCHKHIVSVDHQFGQLVVHVLDAP